MLFNRQVARLKRLGLWGWLIFLLNNSCDVLAHDIYAKASIASDNAGFVQHPSDELIERFPMCDAFLKVTWIDRQKNIGFSNYELYISNRKVNKKALALIHIDANQPHFNYDLEPYKRIGKLQEIFSLIRKGRLDFPAYSLYLEVQNRPSYLLGNNDARLGDFNTIELDSLTKSRVNVCIPYPNSERVWLAEGYILEHIEVVDDCGVSNPGLDFYTTDGKDIYLNNKCKLIEPKVIRYGK